MSRLWRAPTLSVPAAVFLFFASVYLFTAGGHFYSPDEVSMYSVTKSLVRAGEPAIAPEDFLNGQFEQKGVDNRYYSKYGLTQSLIQVPLYLVGSALAPAIGLRETFATTLMVSLTNSLVAAATCAVLFVLARLLFASTPIALVLTALYGLATMAWPYSKTSYSEPMLTLLLLSTIVALCYFRRTGLVRWLFFAGTLAGLAVFTKPAALIAVPALALYLILVIGEKRGPDRSASADRSGRLYIYALLSFALPVLLGIAAAAAYNVYRFGSPLETGYGPETLAMSKPFYYGLYVVFFSAGKSIFLFNPPVVLAPWGLKALAQRHRAETVLFLSLMFLYLLFYAALNPLSSSWAPGPRYHLILVPLVILALGPLLRDWASQGGAMRFFLVFSAIAGVAVQVAMVSINFQTTLEMLYRTYSARVGQTLFYFDPDYSLVLWQWRMTLSAWHRALFGQSLYFHARGPIEELRFAVPVDRFDFWWVHLTDYLNAHSPVVETPPLLLVFLALLGIVAASSAYLAGRRLWGRVY